jgi:hypothetical protein
VKVEVGGIGVEVVPTNGVKGGKVGEGGDNEGVVGRRAAMSPSVRDRERLPRMIPLEKRAIESPHRICRAIRILFLPGRGGGTRDWQ